MAKYKEAMDKQEALERMADREGKMERSLFVGFTFRYVSQHSLNFLRIVRLRISR